MTDLTAEVKAGLTEAAAKPSNDLSQADVQKVAPIVAKEVNKEVNAIITNITNQEPLWQSRMFIGAVVAAVVQIASLVGINTDQIDPESTTNLVMQAVSIFSALYAAYGRATVKPPLGQ